MQWFSDIPGVDELDSADTFFTFFDVTFDEQQLRSKHLHVLHEFQRRLAQAIPFFDISGELPRHEANWRLARRILMESYHHVLLAPLPSQSAMAIFQRNNRSFTPWDQLSEVQ